MRDVGGSTVSRNFQIWKCLLKQVVDGTLTLLQVLMYHFSFFISICSKVRVFLFWKVDT